MVGGKSGLVSTVCACAKNPMISWGIVYHHLQTVNLYRTALKHGRLKLIPRTWQVTVRTLISAQVCPLLHWERIFHVESKAAGCDQMYLDGKDVFLWLPQDNFGKSIHYETLLFVFNYNHGDGGCSVVLIVSLLFTAFVSDG